MTPYEQIAEAIIKKFIFILGQEAAIGEARKVAGLAVTSGGQVRMVGQNPKEQLEELINYYRTAFGPAAIVFSRGVASAILKQNPNLDVPDIISPVLQPL